MKPVIIIAIVVGISIAIVGGFLMIPIQEEQRAEYLVKKIQSCTDVMEQWNYNPSAENDLANQWIVDEMERCQKDIIENIYTEEEREWYYAQLKDHEEEKKNDRLHLTQFCQEEYYGDIVRLNECLDKIEDLIK